MVTVSLPVRHLERTSDITAEFWPALGANDSEPVSYGLTCGKLHSSAMESVCPPILLSEINMQSPGQIQTSHFMCSPVVRH